MKYVFIAGAYLVYWMAMTLCVIIHHSCITLIFIARVLWYVNYHRRWLPNYTRVRLDHDDPKWMSVKDAYNPIKFFELIPEPKTEK